MWVQARLCTYQHANTHILLITVCRMGTYNQTPFVCYFIIYHVGLLTVISADCTTKLSFSKPIRRWFLALVFHFLLKFEVLV